jgi:hypothetical protein
MDDGPRSQRGRSKVRDSGDLEVQVMGRPAKAIAARERCTRGWRGAIVQDHADMDRGRAGRARSHASDRSVHDLLARVLSRQARSVFADHHASGICFLEVTFQMRLDQSHP